MNLEPTRRRLAEIPELYALSGRYLEPGSKPADPDARTGTTNPSRPPANLDVIDINDQRFKDYEPGDNPSDAVQRLGVLPQLQLWQMLTYGELIDIGKHPSPCCIDYDTHTVTGEAGWLTRWLPEIVDLHDDFPRVIRKLHRRLEAASNRITKAILCEKCGWEMDPQGDYSREQDRYPWYLCAGCGHTITTAAELDKTKSAPEDYVTLRYAAEQTGRPYATLRGWKAQGLLRSLGRDSRGDIYSLAAIRKVESTIERRDRKPA